MLCEKDSNQQNSLVNIIFISTLRKIEFHEKKIEKITMNLVNFNGEPNVVMGKVVMPLTTRGVIVYSTTMELDFELTYNAILKLPWLNKMRAVVLTFQLNQVLQ